LRAIPPLTHHFQIQDGELKTKAVTDPRAAVAAPAPNRRDPSPESAWKKHLSTKGTASAVPYKNRMDEGFSPWGTLFCHSSRAQSLGNGSKKPYRSG
jgi:hypothetical protein